MSHCDTITHTFPQIGCQNTPGLFHKTKNVPSVHEVSATMNGVPEPERPKLWQEYKGTVVCVNQQLEPGGAEGQVT